MNVVLSGLFFPVAILRYFELALRRRDDVNLFTVGPYSGQWIPWNGGTNLPGKYAKAPDLPLPMNGGNYSAVPISFIEQRLPWQPDLWLQVDAGFYLRGRPARGKNVIVGTDPHCLNYDIQRGIADTFYCMQTPYQQPGDRYLPFAYDPVYHAPEKQQRQYDACLIGLHYQQRNRLVADLRARGVNVYYDLGPAFDEARALYNSAPIGLNWSSLKDLTARVFELLAMRRLAVVNRVPDLGLFFSDSHLVIFDSHEQAVERVLYYLEHQHESRMIAAAGNRRVRPHTWDARVETILSDV